MIAIRNYRLPPQGYVSPAGLSITKKFLDQNRDYNLYFTFGCEGSKMWEFDSIFSGGEFNAQLNKGVRDVITLLKKKSKGIIERI